MVDLVKHKLPEIQQLCEKYKMQRVWLFGSATDPKSFHEDSDIDFLYEPDKSRMTIREFLDNPLSLKQALEELLGRPIDWIRMLPFRNPYFREAVEKSRSLIYEHEARSQEIFV